MAVRSRVTLGPSASEQWRHAPEHLAMVLSRYRAAAALIGHAATVLEFGCGEGIGAGLLAGSVEREFYCGLDHDPDTVANARRLTPDGRHGCVLRFERADVSVPLRDYFGWDAVIALDVIEHLSPEGGQALVENARRACVRKAGVFVIGTPNDAFRQLASAQSKAEHVTTYRHDALADLLWRRFRLVQSFGMQDTALHFGHPDARHYLLMVGICPR